MISGNMQNIKTEEILLSILLPAYNYPAGIEKILDHLDLVANPSFMSNIEIIIFDNSANERVKNQITKILEKAKCIKYKLNTLDLGPCRNWNNLIEHAKGKYYILMHHDEFPLVGDFIPKVIKEIEKHKDIDVIIMDCLLINKKAGSLRRHVPSFIRKKVFERFPEYLFIRNVIGPTASLIVKKSLHSSFDCKLEWLIDVDEYYYLRQKAKSWSFSNDLKIGSYIDRGNSITSSLGSEISNIRQKEFKYLLKKYPKTLPYLGGNKFYLLLESTLWISMRVITRTCWYISNIFGKYPVSVEMTKKAFSVYK
jgi:glycosyltransferase involved in cell wall biosynthesis